MSEVNSIGELFRGRHFEREVIILCVRWYLRYKLSFRDLVEMTSERGLQLAHATKLRPLFGMPCSPRNCQNSTLSTYRRAFELL